MMNINVDHIKYQPNLTHSRKNSVGSHGGHPTKSSKPREVNYRVHFIHWMINYIRVGFTISFQLMIETSIYVK